MRGEIVEGFVVGDLLGSGRTGLLYHAVHETTGQQAIVRVVAREDRVETELFIQEASAHLPTAGGPELLRARLDDGRIVHLVFNGAATVTTPVNQRDVATERLPPPRLERRPRTGPSIPDWLIPALLVLIVVAFAGLGTLIWMRSTASTPIVVIQQPPRVEVATPVVSPPPSAPLAAPSAPAADVASLAVEQPTLPPPPPQLRVRVEPPVSPQRAECVPDARWKSNMRQDLIEFETLAARNDAVEVEYRKVAARFEQYRSVETPEACAQMSAAMDQLKARIQKLELCTPDAQWKRGASDKLNELLGIAAKQSVETGVWFEKHTTDVSEAIHAAQTPADCASVEKSLQALFQQVKGTRRGH